MSKIFFAYILHLISRGSAPSQACLLIGVGVFVGPVFDQGCLRSLLLLRAFCLVFGMMMTSLSDRYWRFVIAQGLVVGLGCGVHFVLPLLFFRRKFQVRKL